MNFEIKDEIEQAYRQGYDSGREQAVKCDDLRIEQIAFTLWIYFTGQYAL